MSGDRLLTTSEAAERLLLRRQTVIDYINRGLLSATKRGRDWFVTEAEVARFERERRPVGYPKGRPRTRSEDQEAYD